MFIRLNFLWGILILLVLWPILKYFFLFLALLFISGTVTLAAFFLYSRFQNQDMWISGKEKSTRQDERDPFDPASSDDVEDAQFKEKEKPSDGSQKMF